jgi:glycosyltransferase involved in cell wall biosynthesis
MDRERVIALIPAYEEGPRVRDVVVGAASHVPVLVVDDGSTDDTAEQAESAGASVLRQRPNQGKGAALRAGFRHALEEGYDAVVTLDADGQHDPAEIPTLLVALARTRRPELVVGRRSFRAMPASRRIANELGRRVLSTALGEDVPDNQSGYRVVGRQLMEAMLDSREDGFEFEVEMIARALREEWPIAWVPIRTIYGAPSHIRPLHHVRHFLRAARAARRVMREG